jgi:esterase/lipase superfamily enzyme
VGTLLNNLAELYRSQGRYSEAEGLFERALSIREKALGPNHPHVGISLNNLARLYQSMDRYAEAEPLYRRGLAILEKEFGPDHPDLALVIGNLGAYLKSEGRLDEAEPLLRRALDAGQKVLGSKHPRVVGATIQLAELRGLQGRTADALDLFAKAGAAKAVDLKEIPIFFGTNRKRIAKRKRIVFGTERDLGDVTLGVVKVVVQPALLTASAVQREGAPPRISRVNEISIRPATLSSADRLVRSARQRLYASRRAYLGHALVFVHGYNISFDNAIRRAGQLAYDLEFEGPVFAFSWPSHENFLSYLGDRESAQISADSLREFIETVVAETKAARIHIIAHSMGSVALSEALSAETLMKLNIGEIVFASPDIDVDLFRRTYKRLQKRGAAGTVYGASNDRALRLSGWLKGRAPLGYIPPDGPKRLVSGADLIDITDVNFDIFSFNHDTYANSPAIISDLRRLLKDAHRPPDGRTIELRKLSITEGVYWRYYMPTSKP